jgi:lysophospholipase L1-like esterase
VDLVVPHGSWLAIDLYYPEKGRFLSGNLFPILHRASATGMHVGEEPFPGRKRFLVRRLASRALPVPVGILAGVELFAPDTSRAVVAFGDSITVLNQWTSVLANRFLTEKPGCLALLNQGISGNRLLNDSGFALTGGVYGPAGILRFKQDVLMQSGIAAIISLIGINDLLQPGLTAPRDQEQDADSLVNGMRGLIHMAHENGIRIMGGTITPFGGYLMSHTPEREAVRQAVNRWIREDGEFDGVIDFDAAMRDPVNPERLMDSWHIGDHLHPNALGGKIMASVIQADAF